MKTQDVIEQGHGKLIEALGSLAEFFAVEVGGILNEEPGECITLHAQLTFRAQGVEPIVHGLLVEWHEDSGIGLSVGDGDWIPITPVSVLQQLYIDRVIPEGVEYIYPEKNIDPTPVNAPGLDMPLDQVLVTQDDGVAIHNPKAGADFKPGTDEIAFYAAAQVEGRQVEIMKLTREGMFYRGQLVEDEGKAYEAFMDTMRILQHRGEL